MIKMALFTVLVYSWGFITPLINPWVNLGLGIGMGWLAMRLEERIREGKK